MVNGLKYAIDQNSLRREKIVRKQRHRNDPTFNSTSGKWQEMAPVSRVLTTVEHAPFGQTLSAAEPWNNFVELARNANPQSSSGVFASGAPRLLRGAKCESGYRDLE